MRSPVHSAIRPVLLAVGLTIAGLGLGSGAVAAGTATQATITGTISPALNSSSGTPHPVALSILARFQTNPPGGQPASVEQAVISFSHGAIVNSRLFPSCAMGTLDARGTGACPVGARIGSGTATGGGVGVSEPLKITAFNGPGGHSILFYLAGSDPLHIAEAIDAPLVRINTPFYQYQLTLTVPSNLRSVAGVSIAVTQFETTVSATVTRVVARRKTKIGYIEVPFCPTGALVPLRGVFTFAGAPTEVVNSGIACGQPPPS